jgi:hypothetical protein
MSVLWSRHITHVIQMMDTKIDKFPTVGQLKGERVLSTCVPFTQLSAKIPLIYPHDSGGKLAGRFIDSAIKNKPFNLEAVAEIVYIASIQKQTNLKKPVRYSASHDEDSDDCEEMIYLSDALEYACAAMGIERLAPVEKPFFTIVSSMVAGTVNGVRVGDNTIDYNVSNFLKVGFKRRLAIAKILDIYQITAPSALYDLASTEYFYRLTDSATWENLLSNNPGSTVRKVDILENDLFTAMRRKENRATFLSFVDLKILVSVLKWYVDNKTKKSNPFVSVDSWELEVENIRSILLDLNRVEPQHIRSIRHVDMEACFNSNPHKTVSIDVFLGIINRLFNGPLNLTQRQLRSIYGDADIKPMIRTRSYGHNDFLFVVSSVLENRKLNEKAYGLKDGMKGKFYRAIKRIAVAQI